MRRFASMQLRHKRIFLLLLLGTGCGVLVGLWLANTLHHATDAPLSGTSISVVGTGAMGLAIALFWIVFRSLERGRLRPLDTREDAEHRTTPDIECALFAPNCAIAHKVRTIARGHEIDHLVATPVRLWVIATKHRPVPREHLPEVLRRVADSTTAVWHWATPGTPVRGCLVLAYESRIRRKKYDYGREPIVVHTPATLADELRAEANQPSELDERVAAEVWELARIAG